MADINDVSAVADAAAHRAGTRERILRAAYEQFARQGFSRVSMRAVATAAGVTKPALYYYFKDKETLFEECLGEFNDELAATMQAATLSAGGAEERVRAVARVLLAGSPFHPLRVHDELAEHVSGGLRRRLRRGFESMVVEPVTELFSDLQGEGALRAGVTPEVATAALIGVSMAFMRPGDGEEWAGMAPAAAGDAEETAALVAALVLHGVAGAQSAARP